MHAEEADGEERETREREREREGDECKRTMGRHRLPSVVAGTHDVIAVSAARLLIISRMSGSSCFRR